jgi:hypothetical protein
MRKQLAAFAAAVMIGSLAACGGGGDGGNGAEVASIDETTPDATTDTTTDGTTPEAPTDPEEASLAFVECMRDHGVDMPDPETAKSSTGGARAGGAVIAVNGDPNDPTFKKAQEACEPIMANVRGELEDDPERQAEMKEQLLEFAQCMRDHGIDMPDPQFDSEGRVQIQADDRPDPTDDGSAFNKAADECGQEGGPIFRSEAADGGDGGVSSGQASDSEGD